MKYLYVFSNKGGNILAKISGDQNFNVYCSNFSEEDLSLIDYVYSDFNKDNYKEYKVINGDFVKMTDEEIMDVRRYGRILTEEERLLNKLKPTPKEVQKAENTIEILTLIQEVI